jgi:hypothetical protein
MSRDKWAGWWAISPGGKGGIECPPPVDKGGLMNAVPGTDPGHGAMYNGDGPADMMGPLLDDLNLVYWMAWGRPAHPEELRAVFEFCVRPVESGDWTLTEWFPRFADWLGFAPQEISLSTKTLRTIAWFARAEDQEYGTTKLPFEEVLLPYREDLLAVIKRNRNYEGELQERDLRERLEACMGTWLDSEFPDASHAYLYPDERREKIKKIVEGLTGQLEDMGIEARKASQRLCKRERVLTARFLLEKSRRRLKAFQVVLGPESRHKTWQAPFKEEIKCCRCGGPSRLGFVAYEGLDHEDETYLTELYPNDPEGSGYWLHDACAVAVYFCKDCLEPTADYNQG